MTEALKSIGLIHLDEPEVKFELVGYFRFKYPTPGRGVVGEVVGASADGWTEPSDVPVYRKVVNGDTETKADYDRTTS